MKKIKKKPLNKFDSDFLKRMYDRDDSLFRHQDKKRYKLIAYLSKEMICNFSCYHSHSKTLFG